MDQLEEYKQKLFEYMESIRHLQPIDVDVEVQFHKVEVIDGKLHVGPNHPLKRKDG